MEDAAAIIPAYNEQDTIGAVVKTLTDSGEFSDIIVISDGSTDNTEDKARQAGATIVHQLPEKRGKGEAMLHGLRHTKAPIVMFADADLYGFTTEHVKAILEPVRQGKKVMNIGLRDRGQVLTWLEARLPLIGGERALRREVLEKIKPEFLHGFKVESAMNYHCRIKRWKYGSVMLVGLKIRKKTAKVGWLQGFYEYTRMFAEVASAMLSVRLAHWQGRFLKQ